MKQRSTEEQIIGFPREAAASQSLTSTTLPSTWRVAMRA